MASDQHWTEKLADFDRRWIFLAMALAITLPLFKPLNLPVEPSPMVKSAYYAVESLDDTKRVLLSLDLDPASTPELEPYYRAVILQLKRKGVKLVIVTTWYAAPPLVERWIKETIESQIVTDGPEELRDRKYVKNVDYVWLGFREGREATINGMATDLRGTYDHQATDGTALGDIPLMNDIESVADFDLVVMVSAGFPGIKEYVQQAQGRATRSDGTKLPAGVPMIGACTAVSTPEYTPYYSTGQLLGLVGGMSKAAEYEKLVGRTGTAAQGTDVLNFGHIVVVLAIVFGNFIYFSNRRRRMRRA